MRTVLLLSTLVLLMAGCGSGSRDAAEDQDPPQRLDQPYADKVKELEQKQLQQARDQMKVIDEQSRGGGKKDDDN